METEQGDDTLSPRLVLAIHRSQNVDGFTNARFVFNGEDTGTLRIPWKDWARFIKVLNAGAKHTYEQYLTETKIVGHAPAGLGLGKEVGNVTEDKVLDKKVPQGNEAGQVRDTAEEFSDFIGVVPKEGEGFGDYHTGANQGSGRGEGKGEGK